jgi:hypothetical protein
MNQEQIKIGRFLLVQDWPEEILPELKTYLEKLAPFIPGWCYEVTVSYCPTEDGIAASRINFDYRNARLQIRKEYLQQTSAYRFYCLRHEVIHLSTNVPMIYAENVFEELLPDGENDKLRTRILNEMREKHEGCVEDICAMFDAAK